MNRVIGFALGVSVMLGLTFSPVPAVAQETAGTTQADPLDGLSIKERELVVGFRERVKDYTKLRESIEAKMPKLPRESTPEQIVAHKTELERRVREARPVAKRGQMFTPQVAAYIRRLIKSEFRGAELKELRATVMEADTKGVPLRVNFVYPESKEMIEMPPTLLLKLPQLPKQVRYRFVNRHMLIVDRENGLIVDYMLNALP
jgi:hypothetical protein